MYICCLKCEYNAIRDVGRHVDCQGHTYSNVVTHYLYVQHLLASQLKNNYRHHHLYEFRERKEGRTKSLSVTINIVSKLARWQYHHQLLLRLILIKHPQLLYFLLFPCFFAPCSTILLVELENKVLNNTLAVLGKVGKELFTCD